MEKLVCILVASHAEGFCPDGCGCDEEKLETTCFRTDLEVKKKNEAEARFIIFILGYANHAKPQHSLSYPEVLPVQDSRC